MKTNTELAHECGAKTLIRCKDGNLEITMTQAQLDAFADRALRQAGQEAVYIDAGHLREVMAGNDMPAFCSSQPGQGLTQLLEVPQPAQADEIAALRKALERIAAHEALKAPATNHAA